MKGRIIALGIAVGLVVVYFAGYIHGNRSAAFICLEQAAADAHAGYKMLTDPVFARWKGQTDRMLLGCAVRAMEEEKSLLYHPLQTYSKRPGPYEVRIKGSKEQKAHVENLLVALQGILKTNETEKATEPEVPPYL